MIFGVGIDIEEHHRFLKYLNSQNSSRKLLSVYSDKEIENYKPYNNHLCFAISFSCKESFFKAFGQTWANSPLQWDDIEIVFNDIPENKNAEVLLSGYAQELIQKHKIDSEIKFDYDISDTSIVFKTILTCQKI
jgi:phosphopantetheine--protein transferase-like protein